MSGYLYDGDPAGHTGYLYYGDAELAGSDLSGTATGDDGAASGAIAGGGAPAIGSPGYVSAALGRKWWVSWRENGWIWPAKFVDERVTALFDFSPDLAYGDSIVLVAMSVTLIGGVDATPGAVLYASYTLKGARVFQQLGGGVGDSSYLVACKATTARNNVLILAGVLPVQAL